MESVYGGSCPAPSDANEKVSTSVSNMIDLKPRTDEKVFESKKRLAKGSLSKHSEFHETSAKHVTELSKDMVRALKAPSAEIDVFEGDPLEYHYFRSNFREAC